MTSIKGATLGFESRERLEDRTVFDLILLEAQSTIRRRESVSVLKGISSFARPFSDWLRVDSIKSGTFVRK